MVKQLSLKNRLFASKVSKTTPTANSLRTIIPQDLLNKLKLTHNDQICWKLDETGKKISIWKRTKKDKVTDGNPKIIDIKEASPPVVETPQPIRTDMSTSGAETQPQITSTNHI